MTHGGDVAIMLYTHMQTDFTYKYKLTMAKSSFVHRFESGGMKNFATLFPLCLTSVAVALFFLTCSFTPRVPP